VREDSPRIDSPRNPLVGELRKLRERGDRQWVFAEGARLVGEGLAAGLELRHLLVSDGFGSSELAPGLHAQLADCDVVAQGCSDAAMARISALETPPGVVAVFARPRWDVDLFAPAAWHCVAAGVRDPGNLGALVRCAEAAGASSLIALAGSADPYREKALRASAGSAFRVPCIAGVSLDEMRDWVGSRGLRLITTELGAEDALWDAEFGAGPLGFVVGGEGAGVPAGLAELAALRLRIPMRGQVESLNVSVAAGLVLFEHRRRLG
jgi:TrmH family RNA methyltransferase